MRKSLNEYIQEYGEIEGKRKFEINKKKGITLENMINKYGINEGTIRYNAHKQKLKNSKGFDNYKKKHPNATLEEYKQRFNTVSRESFIKKYGEIEGEKRFNLYRERNSNSNKQSRLKFIEKYGIEEYRRTHCISKENFIKKYGEKIGLNKWQQYLNKQSFANSIEGYIFRYGEIDGQKKWQEYIEKQQNSNHNTSDHFKYINSIKYYIDTYGEEIGNIKYKEYCKKQDRCSLQYFLKKYKNKEDAYKKYKESCLKHIPKTHAYYSLISQELFYNLYQYILLFDEQPDIQYALLNSEMSLMDNDQKYFYDFRYKNIIIEYNGDYWHANPNIYNESDIVFKSLTAKQIWDKDKIKKDLAEKNDYKILYIWDSDYQKDKFNTIKNILQFIKTNSIN